MIAAMEEDVKSAVEDQSREYIRCVIRILLK